MIHPDDPEFDGFLIHEGQRYPIGIYTGNDDLTATIRSIAKRGGAFVPGPGGTSLFIPYRKIARFLLIPRA